MLHQLQYVLDGGEHQERNRMWKEELVVSTSCQVAWPRVAGMVGNGLFIMSDQVQMIQSRW